MTTSINHPWAITNKMRTRYGNTWADIDFTFESKISREIFKEDPMGISIGSVHIMNSEIPLKYKELIAYSKSMSTVLTGVYAENTDKSSTHEITIKGQSFALNKLEIRRLVETLNEATNSAVRAYELGLYL